MTYEEALEKARQGYKIRNNNFTPDEYFEIVNGRLVCEMGYLMDGWFLGKDWQKEGWSVIEKD